MTGLISPLEIRGNLPTGPRYMWKWGRSNAHTLNVTLYVNYHLRRDFTDTSWGVTRLEETILVPPKHTSVLRSERDHGGESAGAVVASIGEGGVQRFEASSKRRSTSSTLGRFPGMGSQQHPKILQISSVNNLSPTPWGRPGRSPSRTFLTARYL